jgi:hypothetical protein
MATKSQQENDKAGLPLIETELLNSKAEESRIQLSYREAQCLLILLELLHAEEWLTPTIKSTCSLLISRIKTQVDSLKPEKVYSDPDCQHSAEQLTP